MRKIIITAILALGVVPVGVAGGAAAAAPAGSGRTYVYAAGMGGLWQGPAVSPRNIAFGAHYAVEGLSWSGWSSGSAYGRGHYYGFGSYQAGVKLYGVRTHDGRRYFSWIKISHHGRKTRYLQYAWRVLAHPVAPSVVPGTGGLASWRTLPKPQPQRR